MKKPPKKPHYIKKPLELEWEDEEQVTTPIDPKIKQEEEAKLFRESLERDAFRPKDADADRNERFAHSKRTQKTNARHDIDLHGLTVADAQEYVVQAIHEILSKAKGQPVDIRIITGKGHHSAGRQPQLISEIHYVVEAKFRHRIITIEASPHELNLGGQYLKGHFDLRIK